MTGVPSGAREQYSLRFGPKTSSRRKGGPHLAPSNVLPYVRASSDQKRPRTSPAVAPSPKANGLTSAPSTGAV